MDVMEEKQADEGKAERHHFSWDLKGEQESARQRVGEIWAAEAPGGLCGWDVLNRRERGTKG